MNGAKILEVLDRYEKKIEDLLSKDAWEDHQQLVHAENMVAKMRDYVKQERMDKAFRWLGFIQGIFWCNGIYSIEEMADHNKPEVARAEDCRTAQT